ncbi:ESCRT-II complex, vps25 subunit [Testicularia cyperi]|uniref:ESCRT-II complex subunit VPS25 n=1 Tax=Testicularia cyperi TaxID=1882483 RepID=A0A317XIR1_9BASI|nr:ESCRT-II complex, vps25 subunit [Testicularia cyperi]
METARPGQPSAPDGGSRLSLPAVHSFPPFYTLQPNPTSRSQQLSQWRSLILDFCRHYRIFTLSISPTSASAASSLSGAPGVYDAATSDSSASDPHRSLFKNSKIQRSLSTESIRTIFADLVSHKQAVWEDVPASAKSTVSGTRISVYWKTPQEWGDSIYDWIMQTGQNKSIMTLFELTRDDQVQDQEFYNLPTSILRLALKHLSTQGKAQIFAGTEAGDGEGVKFV